MLKNSHFLRLISTVLFAFLYTAPAFATKSMALEVQLGNETGKTVQCSLPQQPSPITIAPDERKTVVFELLLRDDSKWCLDDSPCRFSMEANVAKDDDDSEFYFNDLGSWTHFMEFENLTDDAKNSPFGHELACKFVS